MVYARQKIFSLPDMTSMQVKVNIHESLVKKVKAGQKAEIRVDAFPNVVLTGTVKNVSLLADSNRSFMSGGAKEYTTVVTIDEMPTEGLKPGMTAEVRIKVGDLPNALIVPLQAVAQHKGDHFAFVEDNGSSSPQGQDRRDQREGGRGPPGPEGRGARRPRRAHPAAAEFKDDDEERARNRRPTPREWPRSRPAVPLRELPSPAGRACAAGLPDGRDRLSGAGASGLDPDPPETLTRHPGRISTPFPRRDLRLTTVQGSAHPGP